MPNSVDLNNVEELRRFDTTGMLDAIASLPDQCAAASGELMEKVQLPEYQGIANIVITGLGGSAIGGDLLRAYAAEALDVPVVINRGYDLPKFVGSSTLVFAVSYSGNTEETLSAYAQAHERGAHIIGITSGGKLRELLRGDGYPIVEVPGGMFPRAANGYLFVPLLMILQKIGMLPDLSTPISEMIYLLRDLCVQFGPEVPEATNPAKQLARKMYGKIPVIWGATGTTEIVAQRWKAQINENAKTPCYWNVFPELNHNEIVGLEVPEELVKAIHLIILQDKADHPQVQKRMEITKEVFQDKVDGFTEIKAFGNGMLARIYSLICTGDYTSVYLAALYGMDPGPIKAIDFLKNQLQVRGDQ